MYLCIYVKYMNDILLTDTFQQVQGSIPPPSNQHINLSQKMLLSMGICNVMDHNCCIIKLLNYFFDSCMNTISVYLFRLCKPQVGEGGIFLAQTTMKRARV